MAKNSVHMCIDRLRLPYRKLDNNANEKWGDVSTQTHTQTCTATALGWLLNFRTSLTEISDNRLLTELEREREPITTNSMTGESSGSEVE